MFMSSIGVLRSIAMLARLVGFAIGISVALASDCPPVTLDRQQAQQRLDALVQSAERNMREKDFARALIDFKEAACLVPQDARIFYGLGSTQAALGDFLSARKSFTAADQLQPDDPLALTMLVRVDVAMHDIDSLKATLLAMGARFAGNATLHATLAQFLMENKLPDLALAESLRSNQRDSADGQSALDLAVLENTAGAYEDAIRHAVRLESQQSLPAGMRASAAGVAGLSYESAGQPEPAIRYLRKAIQLDPLRANSYLALAFLLEKTQRFGEAVAVLEQGRAKIPQQSLFLMPLGSDLILAERNQDGVKVLQDLLKQSPDEYDAYLKIADACRKMGDSRNEVKILKDLADRNPNYPGIHVLLARAMLGMDPANYADALEELAQSEKVNGPDADTLYLRGKIYVATNRDNEAASALTRAIELRPIDPAPYYHLGRLYQKMGKVEMAKDTFARLQQLKSNDSR
jgi:tetratricopeptide (TPR) repeat protein